MLKEQLMAPPIIEKTIEIVEGCKQQIHLKLLSFRELMKISELPDKEQTLAVIMASLINSDGSPVFESVEELSTCPFEAIKQIADIARSVNRLDVKAAEKK